MDNGLKLFTRALRLIADKDLPAALSVMLPYAESHPYVHYTEDLKGIDDNFRLMVHYMENGNADPMRGAMYGDMLSRLERVVRNMRADYRRRNVDFYKDAFARAGKDMPVSENAVRLALEDFVSDVAMLQFENEENRKAAEEKLYERHYGFMSSLFCSIVVSDLWTKEQADRMLEVLLLPTIDAGDVQMIVGALMLAVMNSFDINKFSVLVGVYRRSADVRVRQKTLVGWVLSMTDTVAAEEQKAMIREMCADPQVVKELVEMQRQMVFCMNTEKDTAVIQSDIMPALFKSSNFSPTRMGIKEKEEDTLQEILNPGEQERVFEEAEDKFREMIEMQKSGADIYFGGFSQMKRFPFFYNLANWFTPFNINHPEIVKRVPKLGGNGFIKGILKSGVFCDSDKYSFAIALASVVDRLPENMREMLNNAEMGGAVPGGEDNPTPSYIRRQTLQDLYRFFRLYHKHEQIYNPFTPDNCLFIKSSLFAGTPVEREVVPFARFLIDRSAKELLDKIIPLVERQDSTEAMIVAGTYHLCCSADLERAKDFFGCILNDSTGDRQARIGYAKALFRSGDFEEAKPFFEKLHADEPESKSFALDYAIVLTQLGRYDEALDILFKLNFENPESVNVSRVLAWALMGAKKLEQAEKEYRRLLAGDKPLATDYLNGGYCKWFAGKIGDAAECFKEYCILTVGDPVRWMDCVEFSPVLEKEFANDRMMLDSYGITTVDRMLMKSITYDKITR